MLMNDVESINLNILENYQDIDTIKNRFKDLKICTDQVFEILEDNLDIMPTIGHLEEFFECELLNNSTKFILGINLQAPIRKKLLTKFQMNRFKIDQKGAIMSCDEHQRNMVRFCDFVIAYSQNGLFSYQEFIIFLETQL